MKDSQDWLSEILYERLPDITDVQHIKLRDAIRKHILQEALEMIGKDKVTVVKVTTPEGDAFIKGNYSRDRLCEMVGYNQAKQELRNEFNDKYKED